MPNARILLSIFLVSCLLQASGCSTFWDRVRENEREFAVSSARTYARQGKCIEALDATDRASARIDIGPFAEEAIQIRIRCYERLGRINASRAHVRLLEDFYSGQNPSYPDADGRSVFRVSGIRGEDYTAPPSSIEMQPPNFPAYARRSRILGRVIVAFELDRMDRPHKIRVLEMPHPLLATWTIEAVERSGKKKNDKTSVIVPGGHYIATYSFEYRWAKQLPGEQVDFDKSGDPESQGRGDSRTTP